jgi:hypothetical protein
MPQKECDGAGERPGHEAQPSYHRRWCDPGMTFMSYEHIRIRVSSDLAVDEEAADWSECAAGAFGEVG